MPTWAAGSLTRKSLPREVFWFHYKVTFGQACWAFEKGDPKLRIGTLEMFGSSLLATFLVQLGERLLHAEPEDPEAGHGLHAHGDASSTSWSGLAAGAVPREEEPSVDSVLPHFKLLTSVDMLHPRARAGCRMDRWRQSPRLEFTAWHQV